MSTTETKTESKTTTEIPFPTMPDPQQLFAQGQAQLAKLMADATARWQAFAEQYASVEKQVSAHAQTAVANWAQLAKDAIAYGAQLSAEARKLSIETAKKMGIHA